MTANRPPRATDRPAARHERGLALANALLDDARALTPLPDAAHARIKRRLARSGWRPAVRSPWLRPALIVSLSLVGGAAFGVALDRVVLERWDAAIAPEPGGAGETARGRSRRRPIKPVTPPPSQASEAPSAPTVSVPEATVPVPEASLRAHPATPALGSATAALPSGRGPSPARKAAWRDSATPPIEGASVAPSTVAPSARSAAALPWPAPSAPATPAPALVAAPAPATAPPPYQVDERAQPSPSLAGRLPAPAPVPAPVPMPSAPPVAPAPSIPAPSDRPLPRQPSGDQPSEEHLLAAALRALRVEHDARGAIVALDAYRTRYAHGRLFVEAAILRADALAVLGDKAELLRVLDGLDLARIPGGALRQLQRADLRSTAGRHAAAEADFTAVLVRAGDSDDTLVERALWGRAQSRSRGGDHGGARADAALYLRRFPTGRSAPAANRLLDSTVP